MGSDYRDLPGVNQSLLKSLTKLGQKEEDIPLLLNPFRGKHFDEGQGIEDYLFLSEQEFNEKYTITDFTYPKKGSTADKIIMYGVENNFPELTDELKIHLCDTLSLDDRLVNDEAKIKKVSNYDEVYLIAKDIIEKDTIILSSESHAKIVNQAAVLRPVIESIGSISTKVVLQEELMGIDCKGEIDLKAKGEHHLFDLKTIGVKLTPDSWSFQMRKFGYSLQAAFYIDLYCKRFGVDRSKVTFTFIVVDPYNTVILYTLSAQDYKSGKYGYYEGMSKRYLPYDDEYYPTFQNTYSGWKPGYVQLLELYKEYSKRYTNDMSQWPTIHPHFVLNQNNIYGGVFT